MPEAVLSAECADCYTTTAPSNRVSLKPLSTKCTCTAHVFRCMIPFRNFYQVFTLVRYVPLPPSCVTRLITPSPVPFVLPHHRLTKPTNPPPPLVGGYLITANTHHSSHEIIHQRSWSPNVSYRPLTTRCNLDHRTGALEKVSRTLPHTPPTGSNHLNRTMHFFLKLSVVCQPRQSTWFG